LRNTRQIYAITILLICLTLWLHLVVKANAVSCPPDYAPTGYATGPSSATVGQSVTLTTYITGCASQQTAQGAFIVNWTFGDGTTARSQTNAYTISVTHTYNSAGDFVWSISLATDPNSIGPPSGPGTDSPQSGTIDVGGGTYSQDIEPSVSVFSTNYIFQGTGQSYIYFNAYVAPSISSATVTVQFTDNGDNNERVFDVLVNGNEITPNTGCASNSQGMCIWPGEQPWTSSDITGIVANNNYVQVGIKITTFVGSWTVWAFLSMSARYEPWPDGDANWGSTDHPMVQAHMNLYDTSNQLNNHFLSAASMEVKTTENEQNPVVFIGVTEHIPDWVQSDYGGLFPSYCCSFIGIGITNDIHVSITDSSGNTLGSGTYTVINTYSSPNNSGSDHSNTGQDILNIIAAAASLLPGGQYAAAPASIAAILLNYQGATFSSGTDSSGAFLSDHRESLNDLSDLLQLTLHFNGPGTYMFHLQTTTSIHLLGSVYGSLTDATLSSQTIYYTSTYIN